MNYKYIICLIRHNVKSATRFTFHNLTPTHTPNWCENRLTVTGPAKQLTEFKKKAVSKTKVAKGETKQWLSMNNFFPTPKELTDKESPNRVNPDAMLKKYGAKDWYDWNLQNWGCKWDLNHYSDPETIGRRSVCYFFDSPWGPPEEFVKNVAYIYPTLTFFLEYCEPGMCFSGTLKVKHLNVESVFHDGEVWPEMKEDYKG